MILWRDSMSVQNDLIDSDHRHLICLINCVELALRNNNSAELESIVEQLGDYTVYHFEREERIQQAIDYPDREAHAEAHEALVARYEELRRHTTDLLSPNPDAALRDEVIGLLRDWLMNHVLKADVLMRPFLSKHPPDFCK